MIDEQRQEETRKVLAELTDAGGEELASYWAWERTPLPCGLPLDEQLVEGRKMATDARKAKEKS